MSIDLRQQFDSAQQLADLACSPHVNGLRGSSILAIAGEVRQLVAEGRQVHNLTIGDFNANVFPVPGALVEGIKAQLDAGMTNYPPAVGVPELRQAVVDLYERELDLVYPIDSVIAGSGARPPIYAAFASILAEGDQVIYPVPSWNVNHYVYLNKAQGIAAVTRPEDGFMLTAAQIEPHIRSARMVVINSPQNPSGTVIERDQLTAICDLILDENKRRAGLGERPLMMLYDAVYWRLTYGAHEFITPMNIRPEMANYTVMVDAISKWWCATGLRVGWCVAPPWVTARMKPMIGHMGAWASKPEQLATGNLLSDESKAADYLGHLKRQVQARLELLQHGIEDMERDGLPISCLDAQGAIYLSMKIDLVGRTGSDGLVLNDEEAVRSYLLHEGGIAVVPFVAFGYPANSGWFRVSVGTTSMDDVHAVLGKLRALLTPFKG